MDRYKNLTSKIDQIVNAVKNFNKQASFQIQRSKHRLPSIRTSSKNLPSTKKPEQVDSQFLDKFSQFYDDRVVVPANKNSQKSIINQNNKGVINCISDLPYICQKIASQVELPRLENLMSLKINKILDNQKGIERSKSTKMISSRESNRVVLVERRLGNRTPYQHQKLQTQVNSGEKPFKKCLSDRRIMKRLIEAKVVKKKEKRVQQEITGWDID